MRVSSAQQFVLCAGFEEGLLSLLQITQITTTCPLPLTARAQLCGYWRLLSLLLLPGGGGVVVNTEFRAVKTKNVTGSLCPSIPPHIHRDLVTNCWKSERKWDLLEFFGADGQWWRIYGGHCGLHQNLISIHHNLITARPGILALIGGSGII